MKIPCPYCTEKITYDPNLAGKTINCSYCKKPILMTPLDKLTPEYQQEYREEQEKIRKKQETEQRKLEEQRRRELEHQEAKKQRDIEQIFDAAKKQQEKAHMQMMQKDWNGKVSVYFFDIGTILISIGIFLILIGVIGILYSFNMDITVGTSTGEYSWEKTRINNVGLIADRHDYIILFALSVVVGVILFCFGLLINNNRGIDEATKKVLESSLKPHPYPTKEISPPPIPQGQEPNQ